MTREGVVTDRRFRIRDVSEVQRWYEAGWTYRAMQEEHERKYGVRVSLAGFSELRSRMGWERRAVWNTELLPWTVKEEHRPHYFAAQLRALGRSRANKPLSHDQDTRLNAFLADLEKANAVVHYDPDTEEGFFMVPRESFDTDIIRRPLDGGRTRTPRS